jgi:hypothetical protein
MHQIFQPTWFEDDDALERTINGEQCFKLRTASRDAAAILRMRTAAQPHRTAIAV